jgi:hypothetical protein
MDTRQLAFLDDVEADLTTPKPHSKATVKRLGAFGAVLAAGAAFFTLSPATPASATPASAAPVSANATDVSITSDCFTPVTASSNYTRPCSSTTWVAFTFTGESACGPGGQGTIYHFNRQYFSVGTGLIDLPAVQTACV